MVKVAALATDGLEEIELTGPQEALEKAGATVTVISLKAGEFQAVNKDIYPSNKIRADLAIADAKAEDYDALLLPGGLASPDALRMNKDVVAFARAFVKANKPIAAICHGAQTLIEVNELKGRTVTSWPAIRTDLENAGATWVDNEVVVDGPYVFSRCPDDIPAFNKAIIKHFKIA
ncbi:MAG: type 1 glutamine amidotransferase domain-containing protein [Gluconobacter potus]|uniref:Protease I n=2 Tax=Gluconobacter TaxID=441 RepID=A0A829WKE5_GLUOY|nr:MULTISPECIES: type 1 glutamine amidotransferase domain-containing protein [Gluconobacter]MBF0849518.1 type 1 glutamine amidotransferase [Gluconobacter sp. R75690]MBF0864037.1 type 1 glutamine amidotransferase [Gluconobacter sp. R71656]MBF0867652.1 type 1 glutamine amidotransferase [Gluconobacter sp. R75628]MBF0873006.1 type 1 glutamine amidotransferase [Gluconobacter sp. R75629]MBF0878253.1 type 1 glutamine amidotransferase [Gluconobacter sp. R75828]